jgi:hypothetical protein
MTRVFHLASASAGILPVTSEMTATNYWDHFVARIGIRRGDHRVAPGLYKLGAPTPESLVFVTANYSLSFDALRTSLRGLDAYILVLDTRGVNVWCAAGKHTFGTRELVRRIKAVDLNAVVSHRRLILPQLGAPGVAAHEVKQQTGFVVEYGPVRATDIPEYLKNHRATPAMRLVKFPLSDRLVLIPVELTSIWLPALIAIGLGFIIGNLPYALAVLTVILFGTALFPALLPWLPSHDFSTKGGFLGLVAAVPFVLSVLLQHPEWSWYRQTGQVLGYLLAMPSSIAYITLNFTGSTTFTSRTGVRKEIFAYIRPMAFSFAFGLVALLVFAFVR